MDETLSPTQGQATPSQDPTTHSIPRPNTHSVIPAQAGTQKSSLSIPVLQGLPTRNFHTLVHVVSPDVHVFFRLSAVHAAVTTRQGIDNIPV